MLVGVERGPESLNLSLTLGQKTGVPHDATVWVRMARALLALSLAILIAYSRPFDLQARIGALLLAEVGLFGFFLNAHIPGAFTVERGLPVVSARTRERPVRIAGRSTVVCFRGAVSAPVVSRLVGMDSGMAPADCDDGNPRLLPHLSRELTFANPGLGEIDWRSLLHQRGRRLRD